MHQVEASPIISSSTLGSMAFTLGEGVFFSSDEMLDRMARKAYHPIKDTLDRIKIAHKHTEGNINYVCEMNTLEKKPHRIQKESNSSTKSKDTVCSSLSEVSDAPFEDGTLAINCREINLKAMDGHKTVQKLEPHLKNLASSKPYKSFKVVSTTASLMENRLSQSFDQARINYFKKIATNSQLSKDALMPQKKQTGIMYLT